MTGSNSQPQPLNSAALDTLARHWISSAYLAVLISIIETPSNFDACICSSSINKQIPRYFSEGVKPESRLYVGQRRDHRWSLHLGQINVTYVGWGERIVCHPPKLSFPECKPFRYSAGFNIISQSWQAELMMCRLNECDKDLTRSVQFSKNSTCNRIG